ncbi:hypothetical protein U1Q18_042925 [Sarracenia purpurea var. burkii]
MAEPCAQYALGHLQGQICSVKLAEDVEGGDEADKADAHNKDDGGADLQSGGVIGVEPEHIASGTGGRDSGAAQGHAEKSRSGCRGRRCLDTIVALCCRGLVVSQAAGESIIASTFKFQI